MSVSQLAAGWTGTARAADGRRWIDEWFQLMHNETKAFAQLLGWKCTLLTPIKPKSII